jgi:hypothetical protein
MSLTARITPIWKKQKLFIGVFLILFGAWFFWDGAVRYPRTNERYTAWREHRDSGRSGDWPAFAQSRGWSTQPPEHPYTEAQILGQYVYGSLAALSGLLVLIYWLQQINRVLQMDDEAVTSPAGTRVPFSAIVGLGLKKWDAKGIATVRYELNGRQGQFLVDDYKFDPAPCRAVVEEIKRRLELKSAA